jgi:hypothetical protein
MRLVDLDIGVLLDICPKTAQGAYLYNRLNISQHYSDLPVSSIEYSPGLSKGQITSLAVLFLRFFNLSPTRSLPSPFIMIMPECAPV